MLSPLPALTRDNDRKLARPLASELPPQVEAGWPSREDGAVTALRALIFASTDFFEIVDRAWG
jgi:hypothetical protein